MSFYQRDLLNHFRELQPVLLRLGAEAFLDPCAFVLRLRSGGITRVLYPQFMAFTGGVRRYTMNFNSDAVRFIGWCPYVNRRWPLASEKLLFKEFAVQNGILTPDYSVDPSAAMEDVVVKRSVSSFGVSIKGPFRSSSEHSLDAGAGEYFERFVPGRIAKVWYWNDQPVCLELERMPVVKGNGVSTIREVVGRRLFQRGRRMVFESLAPFLKYQGLTLDTVLERGKEQIVEFRYGSPLLVPDLASEVNLISNMIPYLESQMRDIGRKLWGAIPQHARPNTVFTVDAIVDEENRLWTLEMNSNPAIHPYVYPVMLESLFAAKKETVAVAGVAS